MTDLVRNEVLNMAGVEYAYRRTIALRGISMTVRAGEIVAVTGPSGSGKSTLLHVASGVLCPQAGTVRLLGHDLREIGEAARSRLRRRQVGVVLQFGQLVPDLPLIDNVALPLLLDGHDAAGARTAAAGWLERVQLDDVAAVVPAELSAGQAQRAAVARALITDPSVVFADEPTGSTDLLGGELLLDLLVGAVREREAALVLVTHDNTVAARGDREFRLSDGLVDHEVTLT
ncbi:MAG: ABC transporter ATP-binding protein [Pseudonocardiales bacterium]